MANESSLAFRVVVSADEAQKTLRALTAAFNDAGVNIHIHKMGFGQSDEEIDFSFLVAKALGCAAQVVEGEAQLRAALASAADRQGPSVIEIDEARWQELLTL